MLNRVISSPSDRQDCARTLDEIAREGAKRMLEAALQTEVAEYLTRHAALRDDRGHALVVRNGKGRARSVTLGSGTVEVAAPRVHDRRPGEKFVSKILPPYLRKSPKVESLLPLLYLKGLSSSDFKSALEGFLGEGTSKPVRIIDRRSKVILGGRI